MASITLSGVPLDGTYIVAVSGGVDSVVLLDLLRRQRPGLRLIVAHVEHGIRGHESKADARFVEHLSRVRRLPYELLEAELGPQTSEETARKRRYDFLRQIRIKHQAVGIMTAHHQDDVLETIVINLSRGTGWRGLCSLRSTPQTLRPLLGYAKSDIIAYAQAERLQWRHDATNDSDRYTRNRIRRYVIPRISTDERQRLLDLWQQQCAVRSDTEKESARIFTQAVIFTHDEWIELSRYFLAMVSASVSDELLRIAALKVGGQTLLQAQAEHVRLFALTAKPGSLLHPGAGLVCRTTKRGLVVGKG